MLKNNPTLKDLGNVSTTIKDLLNSIKANQDPLPMEKVLTKFIADMKKLSDLMPSDKPTTASKQTNAQVDSKLQNAQASQNQQAPQSELKGTLKSLLAIVEKSPSFPVKSLGTEIKNLINNEALKNPATPPSTQSLAQLSKGIETVLRTLQTNIKDVDLSSLKDTLNSSIADKTKTPLPIEKVLKEFLTDIKQLGGDGALKSKITDSGVFLESKLKNAQNPQVELKDTLKSLQVLVEKSSVYPVKVLSKHIDTMLNSETLKNASNASLTQALPDDKKALTIKNDFNSA